MRLERRYWISILRGNPSVLRDPNEGTTRALRGMPGFLMRLRCLAWALPFDPEHFCLRSEPIIIGTQRITFEREVFVPDV